jgi:tRNA (guanine26-N2/guanine27-N2)-dimethyltransferase
VYYVCSGCQSFHEQPLGRAVEKKSAKSDAVNLVFKLQSGPPVAPRCGECGSSMHVRARPSRARAATDGAQLAGPMWSAPIHDRAFVAKVLEHVQADPAKYGTSARMLGMLTVAHEVGHFPAAPAAAADVRRNSTCRSTSRPARSPAFSTARRRRWTTWRACRSCPTPSAVLTGPRRSSALLHAGYEISRSHACPGSLKTTATRAQVHDIMRSWVKTHPVNFAKVSEASPTRVLLAKESTWARLPRAHAGID